MTNGRAPENGIPKTSPRTALDLKRMRNPHYQPPARKTQPSLGGVKAPPSYLKYAYRVGAFKTLKKMKKGKERRIRRRLGEIDYDGVARLRVENRIKRKNFK